MSKLPKPAVDMLDKFEAALGKIEEKVAPFLKTPPQDIIPRLPPTENAQLNLVYSYTFNSLFYMYLKTQGVSPQEHPVKDELDRVKRYMAKAKKVETELKNKGDAPSVRVNGPAAERVVRHALSGKRKQAQDVDEELPVAERIPSTKKKAKTSPAPGSSPATASAKKKANKKKKKKRKSGATA